MFALKHNGTTYYYVTNLQGDVLRILDETGTTVAAYTYDPWGKLLSATGTLAETNPLRYRGYYYDAETCLYYVSSRYYDPEIGRWINADGYVSTGQDIIGCNMFAYCGNNPVNRSDPTGQFWNEIWEFIKTVAAETSAAMQTLTPAFAGCGVAAAADGPLPFGDAVAIIGVTVLTVCAVGYGVYQAAKSPVVSVPESEASAGSAVIPEDRKRQAYFTIDPDHFNPIGLTKIHRSGTKNGSFVSWMDPNTNIEIFRWDENPNYSNGPHYHIYGMGHYYPGEKVPEPFASQYFPPN